MKIVEEYLYVGSNRRADVSAIEKLLEFSEEELSNIWKQIRVNLAAKLDDLGLPFGDQEWLCVSNGDENLVRQICEAYTNIAISIQNFAGHRVRFNQFLSPDNPLQGRCVFEYEERDVGLQAGDLAHSIISGVLAPGRAAESGTDAAKPLHSRIREFVQFAEQKVLPVDTEAIIQAAERADIPWCKLDRYPFESEPGDFRIRPNSPLRLGHGCRQHIIDSTFCVDRSWNFIHLLNDRERIMSLLSNCGVRTAVRDPDAMNLNTLSRVRRSASRIGYPVTVKPAKKASGEAVTTSIESEQKLAPALEQVRNFTNRAWLEQHIEGKTYRLVVANGEYLGTLQEGDQDPDTDGGHDSVHPSVIEQAISVYRAIDVGMIAITCVTRDISKPLDSVDGAFVDLDVAPQLDAFLGLESDLLRSAADNFLKWLYPPGVESRIPLIAVTGTNGKTTTSRMIHSILGGAGYSPGLACSDGIYVANDQMLEAGDLSGINGHLHLLGRRELDSAVLETARGGVAKWGFGFDHCEVGVCLNVVEDHLMECGIETLEQMAALKRSIVDRATAAIVLNADDEMCRQMLPFNNEQRIAMVTTELSHEELKELYPGCDCFAVIERQDGSKYAVIYDRETRISVAAIQDIPATYGGLALYNVSNALHACATCYLIGVDPRTIRQGLSKFEMNFETTPGRLNIFDGPSFKFVLDYAHNPDGISKFCDFIGQVKVPGRRFVAFSASGYHDREAIRGNALALAGKFDYYFCFNFLGNIEKNFAEVPEILKQALLERGVPESDVQISETGMDALEAIMAFAEKGDLVVFLSGRRGRDEIWQRVTGTSESLTHEATAP